MLNQRQCCMPRQPIMGGGMGPQMGQPMGQPMCPIVEPTKTNCVQREFFHEVPHVCPVHTHVVNRHIYRHTYTPQYTCSEENQAVDVSCGSCNQF